MGRIVAHLNALKPAEWMLLDKDKRSWQSACKLYGFAPDGSDLTSDLLTVSLCFTTRDKSLTGGDWVLRTTRRSTTRK